MKKNIYDTDKIMTNSTKLQSISKLVDSSQEPEGHWILDWCMYVK